MDKDRPPGCKALVMNIINQQGIRIERLEEIGLKCGAIGRNILSKADIQQELVGDEKKGSRISGGNKLEKKVCAKVRSEDGIYRKIYDGDERTHGVQYWTTYIEMLWGCKIDIWVQTHYRGTHESWSNDDWSNWSTLHAKLTYGYKLIT